MASARWISETVSTLPIIKPLLERTGRIARIPAEKLTHECVLKYTKTVVHIQILRALRSPSMDAFWVQFTETIAPEGVANFAGKLALRVLKPKLEDKIADTITPLIIKQLDPLILQSGSKAIGDLTASALTAGLQICVGSMAQQLLLSKLAEEVPTVKNTMDTVDDYSGWKLTATATLGMACIYLAPLVYRKCISRDEKTDLAAALSAHLKLILKEITVALLANDLSDYVKDYISDTNKKVVDQLLSIAADVLLTAVVNAVVANLLIDIHALKNAFDDKKHD